MQNQQPDYNALLKYILNPGGNTARTAQDILQGTGLQGTYNTQVGVGNAATQAGQKVTDSALAGPVNGSYVNAAPMQDSQNQAMIKDSSMPVNLLLGILSQASQSTQNASNNATSLGNNAVNAGNTSRQLSGAETLNGETYDPNTGQVSIGGGSNNNSNSNNPIGSMIDVNNYSQQGGKGLFDNEPTTLGKLQLAGAINKAGGLAKYRKSTSPTDINPADLAAVTSQANVYNHTTDLLNGIKNDPKLAKIMGDPYSNEILKLFGGMPAIAQGLLGLSGKEMDLLNKMNQLNANSDYQNVHGRLDNYLSQRFGSSSVGINQSAKANQAILQTIADDQKNQLGAFAKAKGYGSVDDLISNVAGNNSAGSSGGGNSKNSMKVGKYIVSY